MDSSKPGETRSLDSLGSEESPSHMIFVGGLPQDADEEALRLYFSLFGAVSDVEVKRSLKGKSKGFGFVWFESNSSVDAAVKHPQHMVLNTPFNVQIAEDPKAKKRQQDDRKSRKILVGNIPKDKKQQEIKVLLERIGPVDKVTQFRSRNDGTYYCYAIMVNFADAQKLLQMKKLKSNDGVKLKFKPYEKESEAVLQPPGKSEELSSVKERKQNTIGWPANPREEAGFPKLADMWGTPKFGAKKSVNVQNVLIGPQKSEERPEPFLHQVKAPKLQGGNFASEDTLRLMVCHCRGDHREERVLLNFRELNNHFQAAVGCDLSRSKSRRIDSILVVKLFRTQDCSNLSLASRPTIPARCLRSQPVATVPKSFF